MAEIVNVFVVARSRQVIGRLSNKLYKLSKSDLKKKVWMDIEEEVDVVETTTIT